jgi:hypothetical protein
LLPGLLFGALQCIIPLFFGLLAHVLFFRFTLLLGLVGTGVIDIFAGRYTARRTRSMRAAILTCFWANLVYLLGTLLAYIGILLEDSSTYFPFQFPSLNVLVGLVIETLVPALLVSLLCGWIGGRMGLGASAPISSSTGEVLTSAASAQLAGQNQLGTLVRAYDSTPPSRALAFGFGTAAFVIVLFIVQRFVLGISGTGIFVDAVAAIAGIVATVNQAYKRRGQQVVLYQNGLLIPQSATQQAAMRWEEIDPLQSSFEDQKILLVTRSGFRVALMATFADFAELKAAIMAHLRQR